MSQPHAATVEAVAAGLSVDPGHGLADAEVERRRAEVGRNVLQEASGGGALELLVRQFRDVLIGLLVVAAFVSGVLLGEWIDTGVILAIVVLNATIGFVQEYRAADALARLKELAAPEAVVVRDGREQRIPSADLVPGDVLVLVAGDKVPADARVVESVRLFAEEAALSGESYPEAKSVEPVGADTPVGDRTSMLFAGTVVTAGRGRAVVTSTGRSTEVGRIADLLDEDEPETPLQVELGRVGRRLAVLALVTAAIVFAAGTLRGIEAETMLLTAVALAVAAIPEGLPAVVAITLSRGVQRMAAEKAVVRRLTAVEALGAASVICTDKTGTLTRNEIRVAEIVLAGERMAPAGADVADPRIARLVQVAALCNDARRSGDDLLGDPTETALVLLVEQLGADLGEIRERTPRRDELAFDSRRKMMTTLHATADGSLVAVKGAPEVVVDRCRTIAGPAGAEPLDDQRRHNVLAVAADLAERGLRTLALAYREVAGPAGDLAELESDVTLVAVVGMQDAARAEARPAVAEAQAAGIRVVMVTGDHQDTARAIAADLGILHPGETALPGEELRRMDVAELSGHVAEYSVYARVDPVDKVKIVGAWQERGEIVAMTGDGVNDAPALRAADIGVAMGGGTDVSKDAAGMVLADDNFATIVSAVRQGRGIFANLKKVVYFLLASNASEVLLMFFGFLVFGGLGEPLVAVQILWINLITDGLPALALGVDRAAPGIMAEPPDRNRNILSGRRQARLVGLGAVLAAAALGALVAGHYVLDDVWPEVQTMIFTTLVVVQILHSFNVRAPGAGRNRSLQLSAVVSLALQLAVVYTPVGNVLFDTEPLGPAQWAWIAGLSGASFLVVRAMRSLKPDLVPR